MNKRILIACLAALVVATRAEAIPFFGVYHDTRAVASSSDGVPESSGASSISADETVSASAASVGAVDVATAGAVAGPGLLTTSADASASSFASAVATSRFAGAFVNPHQVFVYVDFETADFGSGSGGGATTLFVSLVSDGVSLFRDYVQASWSFAYAPVVGSTSLLELTLVSEASAAFLSAGAGDASSSGLAAVAVVPEVSSAGLLSLGLAVTCAAALRRRAAAAV